MADVIIISKIQWKIYNGKYTMETLRSVDYIIIHCSATREDRDYSAEQMMADHKKRGFETIGYHFYIRKDGKVSQHRKIYQVGAHCKPYNYNSIGVCYEGGVRRDGTHGDTRTEAQKREMKDLIHNLRLMFPKAVVRGHCDMPRAAPKDCPCFKVRDEDFQ
jgi:N-acetyl-anhydromuramyl-L-alanine amidase AmpD